jgi:hypothetical protein
MSNFWLWFSTGLQHITDLAGYDHILFVTLLSISYTFASWKKLFVMITAFTLGHSISLAISVLANIDISTALIEFLIALSIFLTAVYSLWKREHAKSNVVYLVVALFGLIHGTGFSYLLKAMLGREEAVAGPLLYFNLGLEAGQVVIVLVVLGMNVIVNSLKIPYSVYKIGMIGLIGIISLKMCVERAMELF